MKTLDIKEYVLNSIFSQKIVILSFFVLTVTMQTEVFQRTCISIQFWRERRVTILKRVTMRNSKNLPKVGRRMLTYANAHAKI